MKVTMTREQRKVATFLRHAIRDYGIPDFDVNGTNVIESVCEVDDFISVSYLVTVGANVVAIKYRCFGDGDRFAYVYLNDYPIFRHKVTCMFDMVYAVLPFARMVQHLR